jgi:hypothetical protein
MEFKERLGLDSHIQAIIGGHLHWNASAGIWLSAESDSLKPIKSQTDIIRSIL